jgi:hypothetical protein
VEKKRPFDKILEEDYPHPLQHTARWTVRFVRDFEFKNVFRAGRVYALFRDFAQATDNLTECWLNTLLLRKDFWCFER